MLKKHIEYGIGTQRGSHDVFGEVHPYPGSAHVGGVRGLRARLSIIIQTMGPQYGPIIWIPYIPTMWPLQTIYHMGSIEQTPPEIEYEPITRAHKKTLQP